MTLFSLNKATLQGTGVTQLASSATLEMGYPRVSHSGALITFTQWHNLVGGLATDNGDFNNTSIHLMNADGSGLITVVPPQAGVVSANSSFLPDDSGLIYLSSAFGILQPLLITFSPSQVLTLPTPAGINCADPAYDGPCNQVLFTELITGQQVTVWTMFADGTNLRQFTFPNITPVGTPLFSLGDTDPRISADGTKVTWTRYAGGNDLRIFTKGIRGSVDFDLSGASNVDALGDWSGDGQLIIFQNIDNLGNYHIGTIQPDGTGRTLIPLPGGYTKYSHAGFFLNEGSNPNTHIVYAARLG